jgi:elongation factor P hydroxylase
MHSLMIFCALMMTDRQVNLGFHKACHGTARRTEINAISVRESTKVLYIMWLFCSSVVYLSWNKACANLAANFDPDPVLYRNPAS